ncbi:MAG: amino acid permease [Bacteroidales bacterium]|nr:amino acid permease [Bacteroidales bacterium]MBD5284313.1 amino acid permease [Bacteroides sp.]
MKDTPANAAEKKLGLWGLTAIVLGTMVGAGIFNIAQTTSSRAALGPGLLAWIVTGMAIVLLVLTFKVLADTKPELNSGIYQYARMVGGDYLGFNVAWGYWLSVTVSIVAYAVMLNDSFGAFFPILLEHSWATLLFGLGIIWMMCAIILRGIRGAVCLNTVMTVLKFSLIFFMAVVLIIYAKIGAFSVDFWGHMTNLGSTWDQIRNDMMVTLWCFIGIEGAVMMSGRAKRAKDVGRAGILGFILAWSLYVLVSTLCYGIMSQPEQARLQDPSMAYVMRAVCGDWAYYFVIVSVIISLLGCWVAWTLVCSETLFTASTVKIMPKHFGRINKKGVPHVALIASCAFMTLFLCLCLTSSELYIAAVDMTAALALPSYFFSAWYLIRLTRRGEALGDVGRGRRLRLRVIGWGCLLFVCWMIWAGGLVMMMMTAGFYLVGALFYLKSSRQHYPERGLSFRKIMNRRDRLIFALIVMATVASAILLISGYTPF